MSTSTDRDERLAALLGELTEARRRGGPADVDAVARAHPDLADELRALWVAVQLAEEFAPPKPGEPSTVLQVPPARRPDAGALPRAFGEFILIEEVGHGGMGVV